jgi:anti-sigma factor RsiW
MLRTAPPETIEQAHAEAFAALTPDQRRKVLEQLSREIPETERAAAANRGSDDPASLARLATRAEIRQPGVMERIFGRLGGPSTGAAAAGAPGFGGLMAGTLLSSMAGSVLGSMIAQHFFANNAEAHHLFGDASIHHASQSSGDDPGAGSPGAGSAASDDLAGPFSADDDMAGGLDSDNTWDV